MKFYLCRYFGDIYQSYFLLDALSWINKKSQWDDLSITDWINDVAIVFSTPSFEATFDGLEVYKLIKCVTYKGENYEN